MFVVGPESQTVAAVQMLLQHVPLEADYFVSHSTELSKLLESPDYEALVDRLQKDMNVSLSLAKSKNTLAESSFSLLSLIHI